MPAPAIRYAIVEAPSNLGLKPSGVERLPDALLGLGLDARLHARRAARVPAPAYAFERDPETLTLNSQSIERFSPRLADAVEDVIDAGDFPVVLGGDCSILLGTMLALRRRGRYGLLYIDGHADFYQPDVNPNGEAASMDLAFAAGYGPRRLTDLEGRRPLVRAEDIVVFGYRDSEEQAEYGSQPLPAEVLALDLSAVRAMGIQAAVDRAVARLSRADLDGFFIHVDADSLDDNVMPAVDYRLPEGLSFADLAAVLRTAVASGKAAGIEVTIYNPNLDADGSAGRGLTDALVRGLGTFARERG